MTKANFVRNKVGKAVSKKDGMMKLKTTVMSMMSMRMLNVNVMSKRMLSPSGCVSWQSLTAWSRQSDAGGGLRPGSELP